jgi:uncharacterized membrane protein
MALLDPINIGIATAFLALLAVVSYKKRIVSKSGLVAAFLLGMGVWLLASWTWFILILAFFIVSSAFTHYKYQRKRKLGAAQDKGGARAWSNVMANGGIPLGIVLVSFALVTFLGRFNPAYGRMEVGIYPVAIPVSTVISVSFAAFLGAIGTAAADTLATEIGLLNPTPPRLLTKPWTSVPAGTSGGVSLLGELATFLGCLMIGGVAALLAQPFWYVVFGTTLMPEVSTFAPVTMLVVAMVGGFAGCTVDSLFGATIQGMWRCTVCNKQTEKKAHCCKPAQYLRGNKFFDNHMVNLISCLAGALVSVALYVTLLSIGFA